MKIYFFSPYDLLRAKTNSIADIHLCEGFAQNGCEVEMIVPYVHRKDNIRRKDIGQVYGVHTPFRISILPTPFRDGMSKWLTLPVMVIAFAMTTLRILFTNIGRYREVTIISRSVDLLLPSILLKRLLRLRRGPKVICWAHEIIFKRRYLWVYRNSDGVIATNSAITADLERIAGIPAAALAVSLNPITEQHLEEQWTRESAREKLGLVVDKPLVVYTGKLYVGQREAEYLLEAARQLPQYHFLFTGGKPNVISHYARQCAERDIANVSFTGFLYRYHDVRLYQYAADALVSYYSRHDHLVTYNLPNKICEYMLTRNPIITSDYPAIKDVLNRDNAILVEPENVAALCEALRRALENTAQSAKLAQRSFDDVKEMTFLKRTKSLLDFINGL
ncbi:MAG: glycosyltransferase family 4 protein [Pseudomonadota bacterium]